MFFSYRCEGLQGKFTVEAVALDGPQLDLALLHALLHSLLPSLVVVWIIELASLELLNLVEDSIELFDCKLNLIPSLIVVTAIWSWQKGTLVSHLTIYFMEGLVHGMQLLVCNLQLLKLVSWINEDAVSFICIYMNVDICGWNGLEVD